MPTPPKTSDGMDRFRAELSGLKQLLAVTPYDILATPLMQQRIDEMTAELKRIETDSPPRPAQS